MREALEAGKLVALSIVAAVVYGVLHDQVTARLCVEYFTIGHAPVFDTTDPTLLGLGWGVIATWWVGLLLGVPLAIAARAGRSGKVGARELVRPIGVLLGVMAVGAILAGLLGHALASSGAVVLVGWLREAVPADRHVAFLTCGWAHGASYLVGFLGGAVVVGRTWWTRPEVAADVEVPGPVVERAEGAGRFVANVAPLPQLVLLQFALVLTTATVLGEPGTIRVLRALGAALGIGVLLLGGLAWRRQHVVARVLGGVIALVALWVVVMGVEAALG